MNLYAEINDYLKCRNNLTRKQRKELRSIYLTELNERIESAQQENANLLKPCDTSYR